MTGPRGNAFLAHWLAGFARGIAQLDPPSRSALLRECGERCSDSHTADVFRDAFSRSRELDEFVRYLEGAFGNATYSASGRKTLADRYAACGCDRVKKGRVTTPLLCECSAFSLQANLERALGLPVRITLGETILGGAKRCEPTAVWDEARVWGGKDDRGAE
jgi:hypothetical protein